MTAFRSRSSTSVNRLYPRRLTRFVLVIAITSRTLGVQRHNRLFTSAQTVDARQLHRSKADAPHWLVSMLDTLS